MSHPVPLNPGTDVTIDAKLNQLCEKCSSIAYHVSMFQKSCSFHPGNPTTHWINHHESSNALITSARAGCHLCTLLLAEIEELELGRLAQLKYQIELRGHLQRNRKRDRLRMSMNPFNRQDFGWSGFVRLVFIHLVPQIPDGGTRHQVAGDAHSWAYNTATLRISYLAGKWMIYCYRFFC